MALANPNRRYRIADAVAGDGIDKEVMPQGVAALDAAATRFGFALDLRHFDFASADCYQQHGRMLPATAHDPPDPPRSAASCAGWTA